MPQQRQNILLSELGPVQGLNPQATSWQSSALQHELTRLQQFYCLTRFFTLHQILQVMFLNFSLMTTMLWKNSRLATFKRKMHLKILHIIYKNNLIKVGMFWSLFSVGNSFRSGFFSKDLPDSGCCQKVYLYSSLYCFIYLPCIYLCMPTYIQRYTLMHMLMKVVAVLHLHMFHRLHQISINLESLVTI